MNRNERENRPSVVSYRDRLRITLLVLLCAFAIPCTRLAAAPVKVVILIGEDEYRTWETLPEFAKTELEPRGMRVTIIQQDPKDINNFPGLVEALPSADLLLVSTRRRLAPKEQIDAIRAFLNAGKPLVGIRTACHAFAPPLASKKNPVTKPALPGSGWREFDPEVLGGHYTNHNPPGPKVVVSLAPGAEASEILKGVDVSQLIGQGSLYRVAPLDPSCVPLLIGTIPDAPAQPVAWTHFYGPKQSRIFYTSLGHPDDFKEPAFRKLLLNGIFWSLQVAPTALP